MPGILNETIKSIKHLDQAAMSAASNRQNMLTKPAGSLGRLEELSIQMAGIQRKPFPVVQRKAVIIMAADHGVVEEGVAAYPQSVTTQMVLNFLHGGAGINAICRQVGARVIVADIGIAGDLEKKDGLLSCRVGRGTRNMCSCTAMSMGQAVQSIETGIEIVSREIARGLDIVGTGDMGIGNTTASSAICSVFTGRDVAEVTGRGTGLDDRQLEHKISVIRKALALHHPDPDQPLEVLVAIGGFEIGGLAGIMLGAAAGSIPVVIDGFISGAAALIAVKLCPQLKDYLVSAHVSVEPGHKIMLDYLGLKPLLSLDMRLGEGTGAALGISLAETSARILKEMSTFSEAGVSEKGEN
jgi:nicotinate-nucleotide--dimethylbenzimidazole phosphoribosyltransferase